MTSACWSPSPRLAFVAFAAMAALSASYNTISDCDETFNYWEPAHYLMYGAGLQTWEYSPVYALRSYLYLYLHVVFGNIADLLLPEALSKLAVFYAIRGCLAVFFAFCQMVFYRGVKLRFNHEVAFFTFFFMLFATGMFVAGTAFLPSSFSMCTVMLAFGFWFPQNVLHYRQATNMAAASVIVGWPFSGLLFLPLGWSVIRKYGLLRAILWAATALLIFVPISVLVDFSFYGRWVWSVAKLVLYNVINTSESGGGSELYGVEPWYFYLMNGLLNFNILLPLALLALPLLVLFRKWSHCSQGLDRGSIVQYFSPLLMWITYMSYVPHKEERFLSPVYPLICLGAAVSLSVVLDVCRIIIAAVSSHISPDRNRVRSLMFRGVKFVSYLVCGVFLLLSVSRTAGLTKFYGAPLPLYARLHSELSQLEQPQAINICVGKEWYRFPSSFFLPSNNFHVRFVDAGFDGLLPQPFPVVPAGSRDGTALIPPHMNNRNKAVPEQFTPLSECHYVVDLALPTDVVDYRTLPGWRQLFSIPFLDNAQTSRLARLFWLPWPTPLDSQRQWREYYVARNDGKLGLRPPLVRQNAHADLRPGVKAEL